MIRTRILLTVALGVALFALIPSSVEGQYYGQWIWAANLGLSQDLTRRDVDGLETGTFNTRRVDLGMRMLGYIVDPLVAKFRLDTQMGLSQATSARGNLNRLSFGGNIEFLPQGTYPGNIFYRQQRFDNEFIPDSGPIFSTATPKFQESFGASLGIRKGLLRGLGFSLARSELEFIEAEADPETTTTGRVSWSKSRGGFQHSFLAESIAQSYPQIQLRTEDLRFRFNENATLPASWRWTLSASTSQRRTQSLSIEDGGFGNYTFRNTFSRPFRTEDQFYITGSAVASKVEPGGSTSSGAASLRYRVRWNSRIFFTPSVTYGTTFTEAGSAERASGRLSASWRRPGRISSIITGSFSYNRSQDKPDDVSLPPPQSSLGGSLSFNVSHGKEDQLRKTLEFSLSHSEFDIRDRSTIDPPAGGEPIIFLGIQDAFRLRVSLAHRWKRSRLQSWLEASRNENEAGSIIPESRSDSLTGHISWNRGRFSLNGNLGLTDQSVERLGFEESDPTLDESDERFRIRVRFLNFGGGWRLTRRLRLSYNLNADSRDVPLQPTLDGFSGSVTLQFGIGQLGLSVSAFANTAEVVNAGRRQTTGIRWGIGRGFRGWLPVVTALRRRGTIR